ncbi:MAG: ABC transporter substrate-binding protein [Afipia sp.]|jgi:branched-chain amino acid transport system substrate-binding protein|nr:ABC transporter substrate-binding protein [Afipia sp.]
MKPFLSLLAAASMISAGAFVSPASAQAQQPPIKIGIPTSVQLQVGRDTQNAAKMAVEEINAAGGLLGRKLEIVVADETENPEQGIAAIKKLTADDKVDVLVGGYTSGVTLAQLPHISNAKTIYLGVGAASPAITAKVKSDYDNYKYIFRVSPINAAHQARALVDFISGKLKGEMGLNKVAIVGENAKWVQDLVPILKKGAIAGGVEVPMAEFFDTSTSDFSPLFAKVKASGAQYLIVILSHASSDVFVKQWHDAQVPVPIGGIDVKSQDADFFTRVGGKALGETVGLFAIAAPLTPKTMPFWNEFVKRFGTAPVYTGVGAYDAVHVYADAVRRAGSVAPDAVIKELEKTDYVGIAGKIQFDDTHDVKTGPGLQNLLFAQWQKDGARIVVWPKAAATGQMIPPPWMK